MESPSNSSSQDQTAHPAFQRASAFCDSRAISSSAPSSSSTLCYSHLQSCKSSKVQFISPVSMHLYHLRVTKIAVLQKPAFRTTRQSQTRCRAALIAMPCKRHLWSQVYASCLFPCAQTCFWLQANQSNSPGHPQAIPAVAMRTSQSQQARLTDSGSSMEGPCCTRQSALRVTM